MTAPAGDTIEERLRWAQGVLGSLPSGEQADAAAVVDELIQRLEAMLEHTSDMITVIGDDGTIRYSNRAAGVLTGHDEDVNGTAAFDLIHPDDAEIAADAFTRCLAEPGKEEIAEFRLRYADGSWHHVEAYAKNCLDGPVEGVVVSMRDITERKDGEAALVAANVAMREFVAVASHELRTPTSVIHGFAATMEHRWEQIDDTEKRQYLGAISRASDRLARLVEDLLTISRIDAGADEIEAIRLDVGRLVATVVEDLGDDEVSRAVAIDVPTGLGMVANRQHASRMVGNYLENALRYGRAPVSIEARPIGNKVEIRVIDAGSGVPPDFEPRLFERFARADTEASRETTGTGLGLSIVRSLAQSNGGDAWYERRADRTHFVVTLPLAGTS
jgi:PAS domain S-box-containing protein